MALRKSPVLVSDVSSHLAPTATAFFISALPTLNDSTIQQPPIGLPLPRCLLSHGLLLGCQSPLVCYLSCDGLRFCLPRRNQSTQQPSQDRTLLGTPPPLDLHPLASLLTAAPLSLFSLPASQQSARTLPNLKCLFLTVAAVSTRRRSSAHQGHDEPRDGT